MPHERHGVEKKMTEQSPLNQAESSPPNDRPLYGVDRPVSPRASRSGVSVLESLRLAQIAQLHADVERVLETRFRKTVALVFVDIVGSPELLDGGSTEPAQRARVRDDLGEEVIARVGGRTVRTKTDGVFLCFPTVQDGLQAAIELQNRYRRENPSAAKVGSAGVRCCVHWCSVLMDGDLVMGDQIQSCTRAAVWAGVGDILLTKAAFEEVGSSRRACCTPVPEPSPLDGSDSIDAVRFDWRSRPRFPGYVQIAQTGEVLELPNKEVISFGRYDDRAELVVGNDVSLRHPDSALNAHISRWHFELRQLAGTVVLRALSRQPTVVDGRSIPLGREARLEVDSVVDVAGVLNLKFLWDEGAPERTNGVVASVAVERRYPLFVT